MHFLTVGSVESRETISSSTYYEGVGGEKVRRRGSGREMGWGKTAHLSSPTVAGVQIQYYICQKSPTLLGPL